MLQLTHSCRSFVEASIEHVLLKQYTQNAFEHICPRAKKNQGYSALEFSKFFTHPRVSKR